MLKFSPVIARSLVFAACTLLLVSSASSATVGYWRFEDSPGFFQDSSGNGRHITGGTMTEASHQVAIAGSGDSSAFPNPIPLTGAPNTHTALVTSHVGTVPDNNAFTPGAFTLEAFVNPNQIGSGYKLFASHWGTGGTNNTRSWALGMGNGTARLTMILSSNGSTFDIFAGPNSNWDLSLSKDYYVAASYDSALLGAGQGGVTLYLKNLTDNGPLLTHVLDHNIAALMNANSPVFIGANSTAVANPWNGYMDEIRFSNTVLSLNEFLITAPFSPAVLPVPEPSTLLLAACGALALKRRRRRTVQSTCCCKP